MAKLLVEIDTADDSFVVKVDGKVVDNVSSVSAYTAPDYMSRDSKLDVRFTVTVMEGAIEEDGVSTYTQICASAQEPEVKKLADTSRISKTIRKFLGR